MWVKPIIRGKGTSMKKKPLRIGIVIWTGQFTGRNVLRGVLRYASEHPDVQVEGASSPTIAATVFRQLPPDGIISNYYNPKQRYDVPCVFTVYPDKGPLCVLMDDAKTGALAVRHFLDRGFRNFAYSGFGGEWWSDARERGFKAAIREMVPTFPGEIPTFTDARFKASRWDTFSTHRLIAWLRQLPTPVAIFTSNDSRGREVITAALMAGLRVPEEVSVLGVDNDDIECEMATIPLSSIAYPSLEVGYKAAETLVRIIRGEKVSKAPIYISPSTIQTRRSTDILAVEDDVASTAYRFIREHIAEPIGIEDIAKAAGVSRRTLQLRYRSVLGRTVHEDLAQTRLNTARKLILETNLPIKEIALRTGFQNSIYLSKVFRRELDITPASLRRQPVRTI